MTPSELTALVGVVLSGIAAIIAAAAVVVQAFRVRSDIGDVKRDVNGRLDELLREREERVRLAMKLEVQERSQQALPPPPALGRGEPIIRHEWPESPKPEE